MNTKRKMITGLDTFTRAYIECALWSSNDESTPSGGEPLDKNYGIEDIAKETLAKMLADCAKFQADNVAALQDYPKERAGHDFWLTRNGHGAGFWEEDFGTPENCAILDKASKAYGELNLYVSRGKIYGQ